MLTPQLVNRAKNRVQHLLKAYPALDARADVQELLTDCIRTKHKTAAKALIWDLIYTDTVYTADDKPVRYYAVVAYVDNQYNKRVKNERL